MLPRTYSVRGQACLSLRKVQRAHTKNMSRLLYGRRLIEIEGAFNLYQSGKPYAHASNLHHLSNDGISARTLQQLVIALDSETTLRSDRSGWLSCRMSIAY